MPLKTLAKFWKNTSQKGATYYRFTLREPLPAGAKVLLFRRDDAEDDSAGNVCLAVDDEQAPADRRTLQDRPSEPNPFRQRQADREQRQRELAASGGQHRSPPTDGAADPGGFRRETTDIAANPSPLDTPF